MGIAVGVFLIPFGMLLRNNKAFVVAVLKSFAVVLGTTMIVGSTALLIALGVIRPILDEPWIFKGQVIDDSASFRQVAVLHTFSYVGGILGICTGMASILRSFLTENKRLNLHQNEV